VHTISGMPGSLGVTYAYAAFGKFSYCICGGYFIRSISLLEKRSDLKPTPLKLRGILIPPTLKE
jgi:hypothetical protein